MEKYTPRQQAILDSGSSEISRSYQELIYRAARDLYAMIPEDLPEIEIKAIMQDLTHLYNNQNLPGSFPLDEPQEDFHPTARKMFEALLDGDHSANSASCTVREVKMLLDDLRGIPAAKTGLTGAVLTITGEGSTWLRSEEMG